MRALLCFFAAFFLWQYASTQTAISGVINSYTAVSAISTIGCNTQLTVASANTFAVGDRVLLIQMQGAVVDSNNTAAFGDVLDYNGAGNYEFSRISAISGQNITLNTMLVNTYALTGSLQLIRVPEYTDATVTGALTAQAWNGTTGGVLVFEVSNNLTLNDDIFVIGLGFRGGNVSNNPNGSCGSGSPDYYYPLLPPNVNQAGAMKGEGIGKVSDDRLAGKGKLANGGGGGNKHNHGGGGGAGFTAGGLGGGPLEGCPVMPGGIGGMGMASHMAGNKLVLGGGGGCGDYNDNVGSNGANGGGLVIIKAGNIIGNGHSIVANGANELVVGGYYADGVGGGGGGGAIFLNVNSYSGPLTLKANGGNGGDQNAAWGCAGTGGGGGTGAVLTSQAMLPGNVTIITQPGEAGIFLHSNFPACAGNSYLATAGAPNNNGPITNLPFVEGAAGGVLPFSLGNDIVVCQGQSVTLTSTTSINGNYVWQDGSTGTSLTVSTSGIYTLQITSGGCTGTDEIEVTIAPPPTIELGPDATFCQGIGLPLDASCTGCTYTWNDGSTSATRMATITGIYQVTASIPGCTVTDAINVDVVPNPIVGLADATICQGNATTLYADCAGCTYAWHDGSTASTYTATTAGTYQVPVTSQGCTATDAATITVLPSLSVDLGADAVLCPGGAITLDATCTGCTYIWHDGSNAATLTATAPGQYQVTVTTANCSATDAITIGVQPLPLVNLGSDTTVCQGDILTLGAACANCTYNWSNGATGPSIQVADGGTYAIQVSLNGCVSADTIVVTSAVHPAVNLGLDTLICLGETYQLAASCNGCTYTWQDNSHATTYLVERDGRYWVTVANICGTVADSVVVTIEECDCIVYIPNAFTPNGDALNDRFKPEINCDIKDYQLRIFDRWGEKIFESTDPSEGWDGSYHNQPAPAGVYVYFLEYANQLYPTNPIYRKGSVTYIY